MSASELAMETRAMTREELRINVLDYWCGCGNPELACAALLRLLKLHPLYDNRAEFEEWIADDGVGYLLFYQLDHMELTEHGGSVGGAWLTPKGGAALKALERESADDFEALNEPYCIHGYDDTAVDHDCMNAGEPVKWGRDGN